MRKVELTKRIIKSLPGGLEVMNASGMKYYLFNAYYGIIKEEMFSHWIKRAYEFNYEYVLNRETKELFKVQKRDINQYLRGEK